MSPLMTVQSCWAFSNDLENQPMAGVGNFKIFLHGCLHVTFIEVAKVIESGQSIETLHAHINLHGVDSNPMFVVRRGQVLWFSIPPIWCAHPNRLVYEWHHPFSKFFTRLVASSKCGPRMLRRDAAP